MTLSPQLRSLGHRIGRIGGWIAVATMIALWSPGVVLQADAEPLASYEPGEMCQAGPSVEQQAVQLEQMMQLIQAQLAHQGGDPGEEAVTLNNRGFNYGPAKSPGNGLIDLDARLQ
ncbi:MAG: hypothetical protein AAF430_06505 [Myxococcota bacterium]